MEDLQPLFPSARVPSNPTESIPEAVGDVLEKTRKPAEIGYLRIRIFSGVQPVAAGEEPLEYWLEQAPLMGEDSHCSEREKKQHIIKSCF